MADRQLPGWDLWKYGAVWRAGRTRLLSAAEIAAGARSVLCAESCAALAIAIEAQEHITSPA